MGSNDTRQSKIEREMWFNDLKAAGIKAVHPGDVDPIRALELGNLRCLDSDLTVGDKIAICNIGEEPRIVEVTRIFTVGANPAERLEYRKIN